MNKKELCKKYNLSEAEFSGKEPIRGSLNLSSLTSIPEGFNPTVGGSLFLNSLTSIPEGFNPTVGSWLFLNSLTSIPEGFNPTVGGWLNLSSLTSIPEGFNPTVGGSLFLNSLTSIPEGFNKVEIENKPLPYLEWQNGKFIKADGRFSEVVSRKKNVWKLKDVNKDDIYYLVSDGNGKFAHGTTIKEAKADLIFKISDRDKSEYENLDVTKPISFAKAVECYRVVTGACASGVKNFIESSNIPARRYSVKKIAELTAGQYGNQEFREFFKLGAN